MKKELGLFGLLIVLCLLVCGVDIAKQLHGGAEWGALELPRFLSKTNLINNANQIGLYGVFSIGLGIVIITGGIDLSVGSMCAFIGTFLALSLGEWQWAWPVAAVVALALSMLLGLAHGLFITKIRLQPFIVTLCGLLIYRGIARTMAGDATKGFTNATNIEPLRFLASGKLMGLPMPFVVLIVVSIVLWIVLHRSAFGRYLFAVGRNEEATKFSGINTRAVVTSAYVIGGLLTGISAMMFAFYTNSISPSNHGNFYELYGIAAAVLGGCSLRGGEGSIIGIVIGTALLRVLDNLVVLLEIPSSLTYAVTGSVVLIGVLADQYFQTRNRKTLAN